MCDYGAGHNVTAKEAIGALKSALRNWPVKVRCLLLGACGSILDKQEVEQEVLTGILEYLRGTDIESFVFETHYTTVSDRTLKHLKSILPGKQICVEMGFESSNADVLKKSLNKYMDLDQLEQTMDRIRAFGMKPILNVFLGAPGLSPAAQLEDAVNSINWAFEHGAWETVIFPANIKPGTKLWELFASGAYKPVSHWLLIELLSRLTEEQLGRTAVSWYGDRQAKGIDLDIIPPQACEACIPVLMEFYDLFMKDFNPVYRANLLKMLREKGICRCGRKLRRKLYKETADNANGYNTAK